MRTLSVIVLLTAALAACSHPAPPQGRWEGTYDSAGTMIAARVEVEPDGRIRVSAPDLTGVDTESASDRDGMHARLAADLATGWPDVAPRPFDFDGRTFRKPGGIAPQLSWDPQSRQMTLLVYLGTQPALQIPLKAVSDFSDNPWAT
jgi:hypothetical protein